MTFGIYFHDQAVYNVCLINTGEICVCFVPLRADADCVSLGRNTNVADINILIARGEICTGKIAQGDVAGASCVIHKRIIAAGRVAVTGCVGEERKITKCRVVRPGCVGEERETTGSRVPDGGGVGKERVMTVGRCVAEESIKTYCRVFRPGCVAEEGISALSGVVAGVASVRWWR